MKTLLILLLAFIAGLAVPRVLAWKHNADMRGYYAEMAGAYLFGTTGVQTAGGTPLSRQQLIDVVLHQFVEQHPNALRFETAKP